MTTGALLFNHKPHLRAFSVSLGLHLVFAVLVFDTVHTFNQPREVRGTPMRVDFVGTEQKAPAALRVPRKVVRPQPTGVVSVPVEEAPVNTAFGAKTDAGEVGVEHGVDASVLERYLYELRVLIAQRKTYPAVSRRLGETGRVVVKFEIDRNGRIEQAGVQTASRYSRLNEAALKLIGQIERYKPIPESHRATRLEVEVPIDYVLN